MKQTFAALYLSLGLLLFPLSAQSHPHNWIDLETAAVFNEDGLITEIWVGWLFDDFYSAFTLEGLSKDETGKYEQKKLDELAEVNLKNLSEYDYFTFVEKNGQPVQNAVVTDYKTHVDGWRLWMEFRVPLETPLDPRTDRITYKVYDPTYYVEILHIEDKIPVSLAGKGALGCGYELIAPEPPEELAMFAASLDQTESGGNELGENFAEEVKITCR